MCIRDSYITTGYNLIGNPEGASNLSINDFQNETPGTGPLKNNGGPTLTHALLPGSLAIGNGSSVGTPLVDQRGFPRKSSSYDIGAYQFSDGSTTNGIAWSWLFNYGLPTDGSIDNTCLYNNIFSVRQAYFADANPTNAQSYLRFIGVSNTENGIALNWAGGVQSTQYVESLITLDNNTKWQTIFTNSPPTQVTNSIYCQISTNGSVFFRLRATR